MDTNKNKNKNHTPTEMVVLSCKISLQYTRGPSVWSEWDALKKLRWSLIYKASSSLNQTPAGCRLQHAPQLWKLHDYVHVCFLLYCMWQISLRTLNFTLNTFSSILSPHLAELFAHDLVKKKRGKKKTWLSWFFICRCKWRKQYSPTLALKIVCFCLSVCLSPFPTYVVTFIFIFYS